MYIQSLLSLTKANLFLLQFILYHHALDNKIIVTEVTTITLAGGSHFFAIGGQRRWSPGKPLLLWLVVTSFSAFAAATAIAAVTGRLFLASVPATSIALAGGDLVFGIGSGKYECFGR